MSGQIQEQSILSRRLTTDQKLVIAQASLEPGRLVAEVARKHNVAVSSLIKWRKHVMFVHGFFLMLVGLFLYFLP